MKPMMSGSEAQVISIIPYLKERSHVKVQQENFDEDPSLAEIADILVKVMIILDEIGHFKYADKISILLEEMFNSNDV